MNNEEHMPPGKDIDIAALPIPPDDMARYLPELDDIEISEDQKLELLGILYSIMRSFVELGLDVGSADCPSSEALAQKGVWFSGEFCSPSC